MSSQSQDPQTAAARRVGLALELFEAGELMVRQRLLRERPGLGEAELAAALREWRVDRPAAPEGDAVGRPCDLARFQRP